MIRIIAFFLAFLLVTALPLTASAAGAELVTSCGTWAKERKGLTYFLMADKVQEFLREEVDALRSAQNLAADPMQDVTEKQIAGWMDTYCAERPEASMRDAANAYAAELVRNLPAEARKPRSEAVAGAPPEPQAPKPAKKSGFRLDRSCGSWNTGRKGLDYYLLMSKAEDYLKDAVALLREERGAAAPAEALEDKAIARWLDDYCRERDELPLESALDAYADQVVPKAPGTAKAPAPARGAAVAPPSEASPQPAAPGAQASRPVDTEQVIRAQREVDRKPNDAGAWKSLGRAYVLAGSPVDAARAYRQAVRLNDNDAESWYELGGTYHKLGQGDQVSAVYQKLDTLDKNLAGQYFRAYILPQ
jgi:tetratricopeptide (TPR) repeat protein